jgi:alpha-beta hydrolase superfamily lysophospholipase
MTEESLVTEDGLKLRRRTWNAAGKTRGIVAIAHGYGEYAGRYGWVAARLNAAGYSVDSIDARGHGESDGPRVSIRSVDELASDFGGLCDRILQDTRAPLFLLGHSLGSLVAIQTLLPRQDAIAGLVLSGNALDGRNNMPAVAFPILHLLGRVLPNVRVLPALKAQDISTDPSVVMAYQNDPLVDRGHWRLATGSAVMKAIKACRDALPAIRVPLFVIHGAHDRMLSPAGAEFAMERAGSADRQLLICPGEYHEPLSGLSRDATVAALIAWLDHHGAGTEAPA